MKSLLECAVVLCALACLGLTALSDEPGRAQPPVERNVERTRSGNIESNSDDNTKPDRRVSEARVRILVEQLADDRRRVRVAAEERLRALGPEILPYLPSPASVRSRASRAVLTQIRQAFAEELARRSLQPSRLTLGGDFPLGELLHRISQASGNALDVSALTTELQQQVITVDFQDTPFWTAMLAIRQQGGVTWQAVPGASALAIVPVADRTQPAADCGVGCVGCVVLEACRLEPFFGDASQRRLRCRLRLFVEPRLRALFLKFTGRSWTLTPASEHIVVEPLLPAEASVELPMGQGGTTVDWQLDYRTPAEIAAAGAELSGRMDLQVAGGREVFRFADLGEARAVRQRRGGLTVTLQRVELVERRGDDAPDALARAGDSALVRVDLSVVYDRGGPAFESHRTWILHNRAWLESADGQKYAFEGGVDVTRQAGGGVALQYRIGDVPASIDVLQACEFVYEAPTLITFVPLKFKLSHLKPVVPDARPSR